MFRIESLVCISLLMTFVWHPFLAQQPHTISTQELAYQHPNQSEIGFIANPNLLNDPKRNSKSESNTANLPAGYSLPLPTDGFWNKSPASRPHSFMAMTTPEGFVKLKWSSDDVAANQSMLIERSQDGVHFHELFRFETANNPDGASYSVMDYTPRSGQNFYRMNEVTTEGQSVSSAVVMIKCQLVKVTKLQVYTSPNAQQVIVHSPKRIEQIKVMDDQWRTLDQATTTQSDGFRTVVDLSMLPSGPYLIGVKAQGQKLSTHMVIKQ
ncbi:hypothetical protein [Pontibacter sp. G13]|uniref:hypothetical protein n=1 Tax=Pontibacter sp. G13 TaxID=3074898 RepID=UPI00288BC3EB|nr:hypothetical protein [Pontibacter sp. G13]WNJ19968.1 hypothetical protein RJD25_05750 [Pontibacter sp. G13]